MCCIERCYICGKRENSSIFPKVTIGKYKVEKLCRYCLDKYYQLRQLAELQIIEKMKPERIIDKSQLQVGKHYTLHRRKGGNADIIIVFLGNHAFVYHYYDIAEDEDAEVWTSYSYWCPPHGAGLVGHITRVKE